MRISIDDKFPRWKELIEFDFTINFSHSIKLSEKHFINGLWSEDDDGDHNIKYYSN